MQKRDFIRDEIERIGKIVSQLVSGFKGNPNKESFDKTNIAFLEKTKLDINLLLGKNHSELKSIFESHSFTFSQIEEISEYLLIYAEKIADTALQNQYAQTAKNVLEYINLQSESISFARMDLENRICKML